MSFRNIYFLSLLLASGSAFAPLVRDSHQIVKLAVIDPSIVDAAIALTSAAAGAASQFPRIQKLEQELDSARSALTQVSLP